DLAHHYRADWEWTDQVLQDARTRLAHWRAAVSRPDGPPADALVEEIRDALAEDLHPPAALAAVDRWVVLQATKGGTDAGAPGLVSRAVDALPGVALYPRPARCRADTDQGSRPRAGALIRLTPPTAPRRPVRCRCPSPASAASTAGPGRPGRPCGRTGRRRRRWRDRRPRGPTPRHGAAGTARRLGRPPRRRPPTTRRCPGPPPATARTRRPRCPRRPAGPRPPARPARPRPVRPAGSARRSGPPGGSGGPAWPSGWAAATRS